MLLCKYRRQGGQQYRRTKQGPSPFIIMTIELIDRYLENVVIIRSLRNEDGAFHDGIFKKTIRVEVYVLFNKNFMLRKYLRRRLIFVHFVNNF